MEPDVRLEKRRLWWEKGKKSCKHIFHALPSYTLFLSTLDKFRLSNCQSFDFLESFSYFLHECFAGISCLPSSRAFSTLFIMIIAYNILEPGTG